MGRLGFGHLLLQLDQALALRGLLHNHLGQCGVADLELWVASLEVIFPLLKSLCVSDLLLLECLQVGLRVAATYQGRRCLGQRLIMGRLGFGGFLLALCGGSFGPTLGRLGGYVDLELPQDELQALPREAPINILEVCPKLAKSGVSFIQSLGSDQGPRITSARAC